MMTASVSHMKQTMPASFVSELRDFENDDKLAKIADRYLHDYSDDEICSDLGKCKATELGISDGSWKISRRRRVP